MTKKVYMQPETVAVEMDGAVGICTGSSNGPGIRKDPAWGEAQSLGDEDRPACVDWLDEQ